MLKILSFAVLAVFVLSASSCDNDPSAQQKETSAQTRMLAESNAQVGMPAILNFTEKRNYKMIYELRDQPNYATHTYIVDINGHFHKLCDSVGYGIPESSQYTSPESMQYMSYSGGHYYERLPQADPNGLYSSPSANGTWVMCLDPAGKIVPVRSEPNVITSPFPLN
jgi:hypothetical protein